MDKLDLDRELQLGLSAKLTRPYSDRERLHNKLKFPPAQPAYFESGSYVLILGPGQADRRLHGDLFEEVSVDRNAATRTQTLK